MYEKNFIDENWPQIYNCPWWIKCDNINELFFAEIFNANELYRAFINEVYHVYGWPYWNLMKNGTMFVHQMNHMDEMKYIQIEIRLCMTLNFKTKIADEGIR